MIVWSGFLGFLFLGFSTLLIPHLMDGNWYWYLVGAGIGSLLAAMLLHSVWSGSRCRVDHNGICTYGFGNRDNLQFPLASVRQWQHIRSGFLNGIGVAIELEQIQILHRKGISVSKMRSYQQAFGYTLVLEFLTPDDGQKLAAISRDFASSEHNDSA